MSVVMEFQTLHAIDPSSHEREVLPPRFTGLHIRASGMQTVRQVGMPVVERR